ncbi:hypothetical protein [Neisseria sp. Ec49-e6-T10]|uniref:hypothetical protein n=1 Tax=Neisseria sp. Ec49-e6-T10 TaxID=3140744 RepID=UPI003EB88A42
MAAQMRVNEVEEGDLESIVLSRAKDILAASESEFFKLLDFYRGGLEHTQHLFNFWVSDEGFVVLAGDHGLKRESEAGVTIPPARFRFCDWLNERTLSIIKRQLETPAIP